MMMASKIETARTRGVADLLVALAAGQGSAGHPYLATGSHGGVASDGRGLADAVHYLSVLHGRLPGVLDYAADRNPHAATHGWFAAAIAGFAAERSLLARLCVAVGPLPSTPGQAESEAAVLGQHHALCTLSQSDRPGCALGAALALVLDWTAIRVVLDTAADRLAVPAGACELPDDRVTRDTATAAARTPAIERALAFGAQQVLVQHRGLWDLLETRQAARREAA